MANGINWGLAANNGNFLQQLTAGINNTRQRDLQERSFLEQLTRDQRDFQLRKDEITRNQSNADRQFQASRADAAAAQAIQRAQLALQQQTANTAQIVLVDQPDGSKIPVRIDRQGNATPINTGIPQQPQNPNALPAAPAGLDAKTWRVEQTKNIVKNLENAPQAIRKANEMLATVDGILNDPALDYSTGIYSPLQRVPATGPYRFGTKAQQIQGQAFLQAFESLKGGGQITEIEGTKATQAIGRLNTAQSAKDYRDALNELKGILSSAVQRQQNLMQRYSPQGNQQNQPQQIQNGAFAVNPQTGQRIQFQNGQWVPVP